MFLLLKRSMYNQGKIQKFKKIGIVAVCIVLILTGFSVGFGMGSVKQKQAVEPVKKEVVEKKVELTPATVNKFLIAYYTKKDLGENRIRYEPLVTEAMLNELKAEENQPVNQAYKGYVVNQVLDTAEIYVNSENNTVICTVSYKNTQRVKIGTDDGAIRNQLNQEAIKLTFLKQGKQYVVNKLEPITVASANPLGNERNTYKSTTSSTNTESDGTYSTDAAEKISVTEEPETQSSADQ